MKYHIVEVEGLARFIKAVEEMLEEGWQLQGGVCATMDGMYQQAMIKNDGA